MLVYIGSHEEGYLLLTWNARRNGVMVSVDGGDGVLTQYPLQ